MNQDIEATNVSELLPEAIPEFTEAIEEHRRSYPDEPMLYVLVGDLFQSIVAMPPSLERADLIRRFYAFTEEMLVNGSGEVRDCFAIELIEPPTGGGSAYYFPGIEIRLGSAGQKELAGMNEWGRRYEAVTRAITTINERLKCALILGVGIGERNETARVIANLDQWHRLSENQQNHVYLRLSSEWQTVSGQSSGLTITGPRQSKFRHLRP